MGLVEDAEAEGDTKKFRATSGGMDEEEDLKQKFQSTALSGKLIHAIYQKNYREGGGGGVSLWMISVLRPGDRSQTQNFGK